MLVSCEAGVHAARKKIQTQLDGVWAVPDLLSPQGRGSPAAVLLGPHVNWAEQPEINK